MSNALLKSISACGLLAFGSLLAAQESVVAQPGPVRPATQPTVPLPKQYPATLAPGLLPVPAEGAVAEILELRRSIKRSVLAGTLFAEQTDKTLEDPNSADDQTFAEYVAGLAKLAQQHPASSAVPPTPPTLPTNGLPTISDPQRQTLWQTARRLDELAANLEELELYQEADDLREQSQRARLTVRQRSSQSQR